MQRHLPLALAVAFVACVDIPRPVGITADAVAHAGGPPPVEYQWTPLETRGAGFRSFALAINNGGKVVGWATTTSDRSAPVHAALWENGTMQDLGTLGGSHSEATAINQGGQVAGWATTASGDVDGFLWDNGIMQDLGPIRFGGFGTFPGVGSPVHFNERGEVVGNRPGGGSFLWEDGVAHALPLDVATDINNRGQVVGWVLSPGRRATLWEAGALTDLGTLGGESWAVASTNSGWVLGTSITDLRPCGVGHVAAVPDAFRWRDGAMEDLGSIMLCYQGEPWQGEYINEQGQVVAVDLHSCVTGVWDDGVWQRVAGCTWPTGMNATGAVTGARGTLGSSSFARSVPFLWQGGVQQDLATGSNLNGVGTAINDRGVVVGGTWDGTNLFAIRAAMWVPSREGGPPAP